MFETALEDGDQVDLKIITVKTVFGDISLGGGNKIHLFPAIDFFGRMSELRTAGAFDFDECDGIVFLGDQVDLLMRCLPVAFENGITFAYQIRLGLLFITAAFMTGIFWLL